MSLLKIEKLGGFVHNENESNYDIAKRVVDYFDQKDGNYYGAIVYDKGAWVQKYFSFVSGKFREEDDIRSKGMIIWKQSSSNSTDRMQNMTSWKAFVKGLIKEHNEPEKICDALDEELDGKYAVVSGSRSCNMTGYYTFCSDHSFNEIIDNKRWIVWRQA